MRNGRYLDGARTGRDAVVGWIAGHPRATVLVLTLLVVGTGLGLRDPWPADEPRFAAIARDMLASGDFLVPRIGGALYADKPPLFFWLLALSFRLTGSVRAGFLLPSMLAAVVTVGAVYDLGSRLYSRTTGLVAAILLLAIVQFPLEFRAAQIDPLLTMLTTLSLYGLLRHLLCGPSWGWYAVAGFASGLGIATKGVGFLPLLLLVPYAWLVRRGWVTAPAGGLRWLAAPAAMLGALSLWLIPLLLRVHAADSAVLDGYLREILFGQTVQRYAAAAGHLHPPWYFVLEVIPWAWLPASLALPWLVRPWRQALRAHDPRTGLLLAWIGIVIVFFSLSTGKRGVYILPAVPLLALAVAPHVRALLAATALQRAAWGTLLVVSSALGVLTAYAAWADAPQLRSATDGYSGSLAALVVPFAAWGAVCLASRPRHGLVGLTFFLLGFWPLAGAYVWPRADVFRSGRIIMERAYASLPADADLAIIAQKESLLLHARGRLTNFGHRREDARQEQEDAARWLSRGEGRWLILPAGVRSPCFDLTVPIGLGRAHGTEWLLAPASAARPECADRGLERNAIPYRAPAR